MAPNPAMRRPMKADRVHVTAPAAAQILDAANGVYSLMLRCLTAVYDTSTHEAERREALLGGAIGLRKLVAEVSQVLTELPANDDNGVRAGVTFAMLRSTEGLVPGVDTGLILRQRFLRIEHEVPKLTIAAATSRSMLDQLWRLREAIR
jgi:hypothetical protein